MAYQFQHMLVTLYLLLSIFDLLLILKSWAKRCNFLVLSSIYWLMRKDALYKPTIRAHWYELTHYHSLLSALAPLLHSFVLGTSSYIVPKHVPQVKAKLVLQIPIFSSVHGQCGTRKIWTHINTFPSDMSSHIEANERPATTDTNWPIFIDYCSLWHLWLTSFFLVRAHTLYKNASTSQGQIYTLNTDVG